MSTTSTNVLPFTTTDHRRYFGASQDARGARVVGTHRMGRSAGSTGGTVSVPAVTHVYLPTPWYQQMELTEVRDRAAAAAPLLILFSLLQLIVATSRKNNISFPIFIFLFCSLFPRLCRCWQANHTFTIVPFPYIVSRRYIHAVSQSV
jgi:hypothetical protein